MTSIRWAAALTWLALSGGCAPSQPARPRQKVTVEAPPPGGGLSIQVVESRAQGEGAYDSRDFARCEALFSSSASQTTGWERATDLFDAARCAARADRT